MRHKIAIFYFLFLSVFFCAAQTQPSENSGFKQEGIASYYGEEFAGRKTASGEIFDPKQLTAAHMSLPFGTILTVTNMANNTQVQVRVNDRGPFVPSRIIDVSKAAAEKLDMLTTGTAQVLIEVAPRTYSTTSSGTGNANLTMENPSNQIPLNYDIPVESVQSLETSRMPAPSITTINKAQNTGTISITPAAPRAPSSTAGIDAASTARQPQSGMRNSPAAPQVTRTPAAPIPPTAKQPVQPAPPTPSSQTSQPRAPYNPTAPTVGAASPVQIQPIQSNMGTQQKSSNAYAPSSNPLPPSLPSSASIQTRQPVPTPTQAKSPARILGGPIVPGKMYRIQVGSFKEASNATKAFVRLTDAGFNPKWEAFEGHYRVVLPGVMSEDIPSIAAKLGAAGFEEAFARLEGNVIF
jgi:rare lipoprotein A